MTEHTPGPWVYRETPDTDYTDDGVLFDFIAEAQVTDSAGYTLFLMEEPTEAQRANARLMAASPDLLNVCERLIASWYGNKELRDAARAAIAKARGTNEEPTR